MHYLPILLIGIGLLNIADYFFTVQALSLGAREINPVMDAIAHTPLFPVVKLILIPVLLLFVWTARHKLQARKRAIMLLTWVAFVSYFVMTLYHLYFLSTFVFGYEDHNIQVVHLQVILMGLLLKDCIETLSTQAGN